MRVCFCGWRVDDHEDHGGQGHCGDRGELRGKRGLLEVVYPDEIVRGIGCGVHGPDERECHGDL